MGEMNGKEEREEEGVGVGIDREVIYATLENIYPLSTSVSILIVSTLRTPFSVPSTQRGTRMRMRLCGIDRKYHGRD